MFSPRSARSSGFTRVDDEGAPSPGRADGDGLFGWLSPQRSRTGLQRWTALKDAAHFAKRIQLAYREHYNTTRSCLNDGGCLGEVEFSSTHNVAKIIILNTKEPDEGRTRNVVRLMDLKWQMLRPTVMCVEPRPLLRSHKTMTYRVTGRLASRRAKFIESRASAASQLLAERRT